MGLHRQPGKNSGKIRFRFPRQNFLMKGGDTNLPLRSAPNFGVKYDEMRGIDPESLAENLAAHRNTCRCLTMRSTAIPAAARRWAWRRRTSSRPGRKRWCLLSKDSSIIWWVSHGQGALILPIASAAAWRRCRISRGREPRISAMKCELARVACGQSPAPRTGTAVSAKPARDSLQASE